MSKRDGEVYRNVVGWVPVEVRNALENIAISEQRSLSNVVAMACTSWACNRNAELRKEDSE